MATHRPQAALATMLVHTVVLTLACAALSPAAAQDDAAARTIAAARAGRTDVPRVELAARLVAAGLQASADFKAMRENAARELAGRPDDAGAVSATGARHRRYGNRA